MCWHQLANSIAEQRSLSVCVCVFCSDLIQLQTRGMWPRVLAPLTVVLTVVLAAELVVFVGEAEVIVLVVAADGLAAEVAVEATFAVALVN